MNHIPKEEVVYLDLRPFWPSDDTGKPVSVHALWRKLKGTPNQLQRESLTAASRGQLDRLQLSTMRKFQRIASEWAGRPVSYEELLTPKD